MSEEEQGASPEVEALEAEIADLRFQITNLQRQNAHYRDLLFDLHDAVNTLLDFAEVKTEEIWEL